MNQIKKYSNKENVGLGSGHRVVIVTLCLIPSQMKKKSTVIPDRRNKFERYPHSSRRLPLLL